MGIGQHRYSYCWSSMVKRRRRPLDLGSLKIVKPRRKGWLGRMFNLELCCLFWLGLADVTPMFRGRGSAGVRRNTGTVHHKHSPTARHQPCCTAYPNLKVYISATIPAGIHSLSEAGFRSSLPKPRPSRSHFQNRPNTTEFQGTPTWQQTNCPFPPLLLNRFILPVVLQST